MFNTESWVWKCVIVGGLLAMRFFVQALSTPQLVRGRKAEMPEGAKWVVETLDSAALAIGLVLFIIQPFLLQAFYIPSGSMENTLLGPPPGQSGSGDRLLVSKFVYNFQEPKAGDVIVFRPPAQAQPDKPTDDFIKRCIGTPGDIIEIKGQTLFRNGKIVPEPYMKWSNPNSSYDLKIVDGKVYSRAYNAGSGFNSTPVWVVEGRAKQSREAAPNQEYISTATPEPIPEGKYLMLGDHRDNSSDGHVWGFVPRENIRGKAFCVFWPPSRIGTIDRMSRNPRRPQAQNEPSVIAR
jgi:signal peptidase I